MPLFLQDSRGQGALEDRLADLDGARTLSHYPPQILKTRFPLLQTPRLNHEPAPAVPLAQFTHHFRPRNRTISDRQMIVAPSIVVMDMDMHDLFHLEKL